MKRTHGMPQAAPEALIAWIERRRLVWRPLDPAKLRPEERIRDLCRADRCGNYDRNFMCPPRIGSLADSRQRLAAFTRGLLLQFSEPLDEPGDRAGSERAKIAFHRQVLALESTCRRLGLTDAWGLIGGSCACCRPCRAAMGEPCSDPDRARPSLEALGIDVLDLLQRSGLDNRFHRDRITWTGAVLWSARPSGSGMP